MKKTIKALLISVVALIVTLIVAIIILIVLYFPAIDRALRPCHYYPAVFIDCPVVE